MNNFYNNIYYSFFSDVYFFIQLLLSNSWFLFFLLFFLAILSFLLAVNFHKNKNIFHSSIFIGFFVASVQIIITVFIIEGIIERYEENQWEKTKIMINEIVKVEIQDNLIDIVYMMDFSDGRRPHNYIEGRLEKNQKLSKEEAIYAANRLIKVLILDDFVDHNRYKKGEDIIGYQVGIIEQFVSKMELNLRNIDRIIDFSQIKISGSFYYQLIQCRKEYQNIINNGKRYSSFLSASEITGELYDYNLKFEMKYKKGFYTSITKTIGILIDILNTEKFD